LKGERWIRRKASAAKCALRLRGCAANFVNARKLLMPMTFARRTANENARATSLRMTLCAHGGLVMTAKANECEKPPFETPSRLGASRASPSIRLAPLPSIRCASLWASRANRPRNFFCCGVRLRAGSRAPWATKGPPLLTEPSRLASRLTAPLRGQAPRSSGQGGRHTSREENRTLKSGGCGTHESTCSRWRLSNFPFYRDFEVSAGLGESGSGCGTNF
jgi:hypothetical protein